MAFRTDNPLQTGFALAISTAKQQRINLSEWQIKLTQNISGKDTVNLAQSLTNDIAVLNTVGAIPGMAAYAQSQYNDPAYDIAAGFVAMVSALQACLTWLAANIPSNAVSVSNGLEVGASYPPAQTTALLTLVTAAIATIA